MKNATLALVLALAGCSGSSGASTTSSGGELAPRPQRLADHETVDGPSEGTTHVIAADASDGPSAEPPPVEPPSFAASEE